MEGNIHTSVAVVDTIYECIDTLRIHKKPKILYKKFIFNDIITLYSKVFVKFWNFILNFIFRQSIL